MFLREESLLYNDMSPTGALNLSPVQGSPGGATQLGVCRDNESALPKGRRQILFPQIFRIVVHTMFFKETEELGLESLRFMVFFLILNVCSHGIGF